MNKFAFVACSLILAAGLGAAPGWADDRPSAGSRALEDSAGSSPQQQQQVISGLINAMEDLAQALKQQAKEPSAQAKVDKILADIKNLKTQNERAGSSPGMGSQPPSSSPGEEPSKMPGLP